MSEDSIFTKIIRGEAPCHKVHEDDKTIAFMDIYPIQPGAVLVVAKQQVDHFYDLADEDYQALMATVKRVANQLTLAFPDKARIGVIIEGFEVPHVHVKVFPIDSGHELRHLPDMTREPDHTELAKIATTLAF